MKIKMYLKKLATVKYRKTISIIVKFTFVSKKHFKNAEHFSNIYY